MNINKCIIAGRLTADPELRNTTTGIAVTRFTVAVNRKGKKDVADFIECVAFRQTAEFVEKYFLKGSGIIVYGSIQTGSYEKDGQKRKSYTVVADEVNFGEKRAQAKDTSDFDDMQPTTPEELPF